MINKYGYNKFPYIESYFLYIDKVPESSQVNEICNKNREQLNK